MSDSNPVGAITEADEMHGLELSIELMKDQLSLQYTAVDALKATARTILAASSIITGLLAVLQRIKDSTPQNINLFNCIIIITVILYSITVIVCILILMPVKLDGPAKPSWKPLKQYFMEKPKIEQLRIRLKATINAIDANDKVLKRVVLFSWIAGISLPITILLLLSLNFVP